MSRGRPQLAQQTGRTFVVTDANSGIGRETVRELVARGGHVVLAVRDTAKGQKAAAGLDGPGTTSVVELDLADLWRASAPVRGSTSRRSCD